MQANRRRRTDAGEQTQANRRRRTDAGEQTQANRCRRTDAGEQTQANRRRRTDAGEQTQGRHRADTGAGFACVWPDMSCVCLACAWPEALPVTRLRLCLARHVCVKIRRMPRIRACHVAVDMVWRCCRHPVGCRQQSLTPCCRRVVWRCCRLLPAYTLPAGRHTVPALPAVLHVYALACCPRATRCCLLTRAPPSSPGLLTRALSRTCKYNII